MTTKAIHEAISRETQAKFPYLIHISHEVLGDWYYCNSSESITYEGQTYKPCVFTLEQPEKTSSSLKNTRLTLSAVDTEEDWIGKIRNSGFKRFNMEMVAAILYYNGNTPVLEEVEKNSFVLTNASWTEISVSWTVVFDENMDVLVPMDVAGVGNVPGCV